MAYPKRLFIGLDLSLANGWPNSIVSGSWYNKTTGVITCGAIIPCNEVIVCL
jgi:hypothetical protein